MQPRVLLVLLLVAATALFVVGVSVEKSSGDTHETSAAATEPGGGAETGDEHAGESAEAAESGETAESAEADEAREGHAEPAGGEASEEDETLLGIGLEAAGFVALAAAVSLALACGLAAARLGFAARRGGRGDGRLRRARCARGVPPDRRGRRRLGAARGRSRRSAPSVRRGGPADATRILHAGGRRGRLSTLVDRVAVASEPRRSR
jgi:hypothetical protein